MPPIRTTQNVLGRLIAALTLTAVGWNAPLIAHDDDRIDPLVGVWESVSSGQVDCQTGQPLPDAPIIRAVYTIHHGGTMSEQNTDPIEGPYRSSGFGLWKRTLERSYEATYQHCGFVDENLMPTKQLAAIVKVRTSIRLSREDVRRERRVCCVLPDPVTSDLGDVVFSGCFAARALRMAF